MKTTYLQSRNINKKKNVWVFIFIIFVVLVVSNKYLRQIVYHSITASFTPFLKISRLTGERWNNLTFIFKDKNRLGYEIENLTFKKAELEKEILALDYLRAENEELKSLLSRAQNKKLVLASIISRPPQSPYDVVIIDVGTKEGIEPGMRVIADSNVIMGHVSEVFSKSSKVTLISSPGGEINVFIENAKIAAVGVGLGGGNMEIKIPGSIQINLRDQITTTEIFPLLVGEVEKIEKNSSDPFQRILFRLLVNFQQMKYVTIER